MSEFRANAAKFIDQVRATRKPLVITQHGRGAAVLVDIETWEGLVDELEVRRAVAESDADRAAGKPLRTTEDVMLELRARHGV